jgi:tetratricopeptide (TPR) repeat protein
MAGPTPDGDPYPRDRAAHVSGIPETAARRDIRSAAAIAIVAALSYANALANRFALDDTNVIQTNPLVHRFAGVWHAFAHSYWPEATGAGQYRPLTMATFAMDWAVSGGGAAWLHAANVLWHVAACLLVWRLLVDLTSPRGALVGASVFAVHPVHVEAVSNLVGRSDVICAAFTIAALLAHRRRQWIAIICYAAALCAKESGVTFLGLAVASDLLLADPRPSPRTAVAPPDPGLPVSARSWRWPLYGGYAAVTAAYGAVLAHLFHDMPLVRVAEPWQHASTVERLFTVARIVPEYLRLLLFPAQLHVDYMPRLIEVEHGPTVAAAFGLAIVIALSAVVIRTWRRAPVVAFAVVLFACTIAPVANVFFPSGLMLAERTLYLPSVALAILVAWSWDQWAASRRLERPAVESRVDAEMAIGWAHRHLPVAAVAVIVCVLAARTWTRTPIWRNDKTMLVASLIGEPESYRVHERAADVMYRTGNLPGAIHEYAIARTLYPVAPLLYQAPAALLAAHGRDADANQLLDSARLIDPSPYSDAMRRAWVRYAARDYRGSIAWARSAYLMQRDSVDALMVLTQAAQQIDDVSDATTAFRLGLADHPRNRALHRSYAAMLAAVGDSTASRREAGLGAGS